MNDTLYQAFSERLKQEFVALWEESNKAKHLIYSQRVSRISWKNSQKHCKWLEGNPLVLMPDNTRFYYRSGNTEILLMEFQPQIRLVKFSKDFDCIVFPTNGSEYVNEYNTYTLPFPYLVFVFKFVKGFFSSLYLSFGVLPLQRLEMQPLIPFLPNIHKLKVCLGDKQLSSQLVPHDIAQQTTFILDHFWSSVFNKEYSEEYHYIIASNRNDGRLSGLNSWQQAGKEDPLFVLDVPWMASDRFPDYAHLIRDLVKGDDAVHAFQTDLFEEISKEFVGQIQQEGVNQLENAITTTINYFKKLEDKK